MTSKKIYLIRHGQTDYNLNKIVQGSGVNSSLNETGRLQAEAFYQKYSSVDFDNIYTSTLARTIETVQPFLNAGYEHQPHEGLKEISWGSKEGIKIEHEEEVYYDKVIAAWRKGDLHQKMANGESPEEVAFRLRATINEILANEDEETILICMHGRAMRILLCILLNYPISCMDFFPHSNTSLYKLIFTGNLTRIKLFNDLHHLELLES
ncbi:MAG: histidine phosphatase family protein [Candidatus Cyclobacteriaceae bacterium M2_1C_046]